MLFDSLEEKRSVRAAGQTAPVTLYLDGTCVIPACIVPDGSVWCLFLPTEMDERGAPSTPKDVCSGSGVVVSLMCLFVHLPNRQVRPHLLRSLLHHLRQATRWPLTPVTFNPGFRHTTQSLRRSNPKRPCLLLPVKCTLHSMSACTPIKRAAIVYGLQ